MLGFDNFKGAAPNEEECFLSVDTLNRMDWCLDQLEHLQTHRSVSDMAAEKFRRMLNRELSMLSRGSKEGLSISNHITSTYTGRKQLSRELIRTILSLKNNNTSMSSQRRMRLLKMLIQLCGKKTLLGMAKVFSGKTLKKNRII